MAVLLWTLAWAIQPRRKAIATMINPQPEIYGYPRQELTRHVLAMCDQFELEGVVSPAADLDGIVTFVDDATGEKLALNGWLWSFMDCGR